MGSHLCKRRDVADRSRSLIITSFCSFASLVSLDLPPNIKKKMLLWLLTQMTTLTLGVMWIVVGVSKEAQIAMALNLPIGPASSPTTPCPCVSITHNRLGPPSDSCALKLSGLCLGTLAPPHLLPLVHSLSKPWLTLSPVQRLCEHPLSQDFMFLWPAYSSGSPVPHLPRKTQVATHRPSICTQASKLLGSDLRCD